MLEGRLQGRQVWPGRFEGYEPAGTAARAATGCPASGEFIWPVAEAVWGDGSGDIHS
ncbi:hypothetical protein FPOAC1_012838 [Fusarium poae]|uniref:hypothetical protein n=1 Tax=Fusarium poae TaxID=36050 RepID=UPI001CE7CC7E|nr:hypothetical protein FPOAC1_012838 [Fusarium poae]KAG8667995.1 hypothetical protein FPOAC1_012838 [Fusarium poae]